MKFIFILLVLVFSITASARQYIQCSDSNSFDRFVINLDSDQSTFFYTNGVHLPDDSQIRSLTELSFDRETNESQIFVTSLHSSNLFIEIKKSDLDISSNYLEIDFDFINRDGESIKNFSVACFSSIH